MAAAKKSGYNIFARIILIPLSYQLLIFALAMCFIFLMSEIFLTQKVVFEADAIFYLPLVNEFVFLPISNTNKLSSNATNITHFR